MHRFDVTFHTNAQQMLRITYSLLVIIDLSSWDKMHWFDVTLHTNAQIGVINQGFLFVLTIKMHRIDKKTKILTLPLTTKCTGFCAFQI